MGDPAVQARPDPALGGVERLPLLVTTTRRAGDRERDRAAEVAATCQAPRVRHRGIDHLLARAEAVYVVGADRDRVHTAGAVLRPGEGLMKLKTKDGRGHPILRAVAPLEAPPPELLIDATLGLAQDALHISELIGCPVLGLEASAPLFCLVQDILRRLQGSRWSAAAARICLEHGRAEALLAARAPNSASVVFLDPMFERPRRAAPGFSVLRTLAEPAPLSAALLAAALRVARDRVVLKLPTGAQPPVPAPPPGFNRKVPGKAFDYWIVERRPPP